MDLASFAQVSVAGVPLVLVVIGMTYWAKSFKKPDGNQLITGNGLLVISMAIGLVLGGGYMLTQTRPPAGDWWPAVQYWFALAVYGLAMGLVASGIYEVAKGIVEKTFSSQLAKIWSLPVIAELASFENGGAGQQEKPGA